VVLFLLKNLEPKRLKKSGGVDSGWCLFTKFDYPIRNNNTAPFQKFKKMLGYLWKKKDVFHLKSIRLFY